MNSLIRYDQKTYTCLDNMSGFFLNRFGFDRHSDKATSKVFYRLLDTPLRLLRGESTDLQYNAYVRMREK